MKYSIEEIEERVYALLDENIEIIEERVTYCDPGASLSGLVRTFLRECARAVILEAPPAGLDECVRCTVLNARHEPEACKAVLTLPRDYLRLVYLRMSDWSNGIDILLDTSSEEYMLRLRAGRRRPRRTSPAAAVRCRGESRILEIFGTCAGSAITDLDYVATPVLEDGRIDLPPGVFSAVCSRLAETIRAIIS